MIGTLVARCGGGSRRVIACAGLAAISMLACSLSAVAAGRSEAGQVRWVWSGGVTSSTAIVKARVNLPSVGVRLRVSRSGAAEDGGRFVPVDGAATPDAEGVVAFPVDGLAPATRYRYSVETIEGASLQGSFRTWGDGPFSFRAAFASCASTGSNSPVFDSIRALAPDVFIHMGDFHYENIARNSPDRFRRAYDKVLASPRQSALYRATPLVYVWDDHDFGPNNADGSSPSKPAAFSTYRQLVPHYPLGTPEAQSVNQAFTIGRVRFIVTDGRSARAPADSAASRRTMLGATQLAWLERELKEAAAHPLVVWVNTVPWITRRKSGPDGWQHYASERAWIADLIESVGLRTRMVMLSGDAHMVAIDDGTNSNYATGAAAGVPGFPVVHAAPMDRRTSEKGGPYTNGVSRQRGQFGLMDVRDDGQTIRVELTGRDVAGAVIPRMRIAVECGTAGCRVVESDAAR